MIASSVPRISHQSETNFTNQVRQNDEGEWQKKYHSVSPTFVLKFRFKILVATLAKLSWLQYLTLLWSKMYTKKIAKGGHKMLVILTPFLPSHPSKLSQSPNVYCVLCTARKIKTKNVIRNQDKTESQEALIKWK